MNIDEILNNIGGGNNMLSFNIFSLLKIPTILIMVGNIFFSLLLFLRVRILADIFKAPENKIVKTIVLLYIFITLIGSLLSLLFVMLI